MKKKGARSNNNDLKPVEDTEVKKNTKKVTLYDEVLETPEVMPQMFRVHHPLPELKQKNVNLEKLVVILLFLLLFQKIIQFIPNLIHQH